MNEDFKPGAPTGSLVAGSASDELDIQREGEGHVEDDQPTYPAQTKDPLGQNGPSYEMNQFVKGKEVHPGGSVNEHGDLSHADGEN